MDTERIISLAVLGFVACAMGISIFYRSRASAHGKDPYAKSEGGFAFIAARLLLVASVLSFFIAYALNPAWVSWAAYPAPMALRLAGGAVSAASLPLLLWLFRHLGDNVTPTKETRIDHSLVTTGPYRWIRHPLYTFGMTFWFGLSLFMATWVLPILLFAGMIYLAKRTPIEEENLVGKFGQEYREYMARTGRYLPRMF